MVSQPYGRGAMPQAPLSCQVCGAAPAASVRFLKHVGMVIMWQQVSYRGVYCRDCGLAVFRQIMNKTLAFGWWGIASFFLNIYAILVNLFSWQRLRNLAEPVRVGDKPALDPGRPVLARPGAWVTALAVVAGLAIISLGVLGSSLDSIPAEDRALIGTCVQNMGNKTYQRADCSGPHSGKITWLSRTTSGCASRSVRIKLPDGVFACSDPTQ